MVAVAGRVSASFSNLHAMADARGIGRLPSPASLGGVPRQRVAARDLFPLAARRRVRGGGRVMGCVHMPTRFRLAPVLALAALTIATPASAQGLFGMLFGGAPRAPLGYIAV